MQSHLAEQKSYKTNWDGLCMGEITLSSIHLFKDLHVNTCIIPLSKGKKSMRDF